MTVAVSHTCKGKFPGCCSWTGTDVTWAVLAGWLSIAYRRRTLRCVGLVVDHWSPVPSSSFVEEVVSIVY